ncbi:MAG TPA: hypothetical protein PKO06_12845 [Candidatus Ozemobacteraceae bacterium]|nr:hypothetical protein [Candidatus Ozemobacteraceae bacterium]
MNWRRATLCLWLFSVWFTCYAGSVLANGPIDRLDRWFVFGTNLAWFNNNYGADIGVNHAEGGWQPTFTRENAERVFANLAKMGCPVVRIWAFERQEGLLFTPDLTSDPKYPYHEVTGLCPVFLRNCRTIMELAEKYRVKVYWSLLNHLIREEQGGRHLRIITETKVRNSYIRNAAVPFVKAMAASPAFFAVDIINEADGTIGKIDALSGCMNPLQGCTWKEMRVFIKACAEAFHAAVPGIKVTATSGWHEEKNVKAGRFSGLGLDFYDWHSYRDVPDLPHARTLGLDKPVIIGECGPKTQDPDAGYKLQWKNWWAYLAQARKGYAGLLTWSYGNPGGATNFVMVEADHAWRAGAKMIYQATRGAHIPDAGPLMLTDDETRSLEAVNRAMQPILQLAGRSSLPASGEAQTRLKQLVKTTGMYYPYLNPKYAVVSFVRVSETLVAVIRHEQRVAGSENLESLKQIGRDVLASIQTIEPLSQLQIVKTLTGLVSEVPSSESAGASPYDTDALILTPSR